MRLLPFAGVSMLAMATALQAQEANSANETVLDTITVISQGKDNAGATGGTVLTQEDIERVKPADVSELFSRTSSVTVSGGGGPSKRIHVLGMEQSNLAVTVDGVPQTATSWHHTGSNVIDPVFLKRVEVEAGAAAADSGFAAAAGAVRYETVGALDLLEEGRNFGGRVGLSWGTNGRGFSASTAAYGRHEGFDWFVMGHGTAGKNYKSGDGLEILGTEPAARNILGKLGYEVDGHRFDLGYERGRDKADRLIKMNMGLAGDTVHPLEVSRDAVNLKYTSTAPTDLWDPEATVYYTKNDYWRTNYEARTNGNMTLEEDLYGGKVQNTFTVDYGKITAGVDFGRHDYFTDNYGNNDRRYRDFYTAQVGAFTQGRFEFDNGFTVSAGGRYDGHRFTDWDGNTFSDSGGSLNATVAYRFNEGIEVFAGASRTWLGYVIGDYGYVHARNNAFATDPNFDTGTAQNYKVGANFGGDSWSAGVTLFDTRIRGLPLYDVATATNMLLNDPEEHRSRGVTLNASYRWDNTRIGATYTHARVTAGGATMLPDSGTFMPIGDMATLYIDHEIPDYHLKLGATVAWAGRIAAIGTFYEQPSYTVVNAYAEWTPPSYENLTVRVGVDNLFDATYYERAGYAASTARGGIDPVYAPGRTFTFQTALKF